YLLEQLDGLRSHPTVGDVRGLGLQCGVELVRGQQTRERWGVKHPFIKAMGGALERRGVLTRVWDVVHLCPPLVVTRDEIDRIVTELDASLTECERAFGAEIDA